MRRTRADLNQAPLACKARTLTPHHQDHCLGKAKQVKIMTFGLVRATSI